MKALPGSLAGCVILLLAACSVFSLGGEEITISGTVYYDSVPASRWLVRLRTLTNIYGSGPTIDEAMTDSEGRYDLSATVNSEDCEVTAAEPAETGPLGTCRVNYRAPGRCGRHEGVDFFCPG